MIYLIDILFWYTFIVYKNSGMKTISLKLDESIFGETEKILPTVKKSRNRYINDAVDYYNRIQRRLILEKRMRQESGLVKENSMSVLKDFEEIDYVD